MQIADTNVLVYATDEEATHHDRSRAWLDGVLGAGGETLGLSWQVLLSFLRLTTSAAIFTHPLTVGEASTLVEGWVGRPNAVLLVPDARHVSALRRLLTDVGTAGDLVNDAHLAALAIEHDAEVVSFDRDFARFEGVRWRLPG